MEHSLYLEMTSEIAEEWLHQIYDGYPYQTDDNGNVSYTEEAQEIFNRLLDEVTNISGQYIRVTGE